MEQKRCHQVVDLPVEKHFGAERDVAILHRKPVSRRYTRYSMTRRGGADSRQKQAKAEHRPMALIVSQLALFTAETINVGSKLLWVATVIVCRARIWIRFYVVDMW